MAVEQRPRPDIRLNGRDLRRHLADAVIPNAAFLIFYETYGVLGGVVAAVIAGTALLVARLLKKRPLKVVFAAFGLVIAHAVMVLITGEGRDFFLPWLVLNGVAAAGFLISLVIRKPVSAKLSRFSGLTADRRQHRKVTALWSGLWLLHIAVGLPLYLTHQVVALGVAHFVLGPPALLLWGFLTWRMLREGRS
jgi:intracellular septation protein A